MRHALIYKKAELLDHFIDVYKRARKRRSFPHKAVGTVILPLFPGSASLGRGAFKTVHKISVRERDLVLNSSQFQLSPWWWGNGCRGLAIGL